MKNKRVKILTVSIWYSVIKNFIIKARRRDEKFVSAKARSRLKNNLSNPVYELPNHQSHVKIWVREKHDWKLKFKRDADYAVALLVCL